MFREPAWQVPAINMRRDCRSDGGVDRRRRGRARDPHRRHLRRAARHRIGPSPPRRPPNRGSTRRRCRRPEEAWRGRPLKAASRMKRLHRAATNGAPGGARGPAPGTPHRPSHAPSRPPILAPIHAHGLGFGRLGRDERGRRDGNRCRRQPTKQSSTRNRFRHENLLQQVPQQGGLADLARASLAYWDSRSGELGQAAAQPGQHRAGGAVLLRTATI